MFKKKLNQGTTTCLPSTNLLLARRANKTNLLPVPASLLRERRRYWYLESVVIQEKKAILKEKIELQGMPEPTSESNAFATVPGGEDNASRDVSQQVKGAHEDLVYILLYSCMI